MQLFILSRLIAEVFSLEKFNYLTIYNIIILLSERNEDAFDDLKEQNEYMKILI